MNNRNMREAVSKARSSVANLRVSVLDDAKINVALARVEVEASKVEIQEAAVLASLLDNPAYAGRQSEIAVRLNEILGL